MILQKLVFRLQDEFNDKFRETHSLYELMEIVPSAHEIIEANAKTLVFLNKNERYLSIVKALGIPG